MRGRVLVIAGSDSGGGAGIQADLKAVTMLDAYAATAITAITAQSTMGVFGVLALEPALVAQQARVVLEDIGADAIKTGMLPNAGVIEAVASVLSTAAPATSVVVDPVMVAKGGASLMDADASRALVTLLLPRAHVLTPNVPEAEALLGRKIVTEADLESAGRALLELGPRAVLMKGGHREGETILDMLVSREAPPRAFSHPRLDTRHTHGTGCTLASALAAGLAQGMPLAEATARAIDYVTRAIASAPGLGRGHGPIDHAWPLRKT